MKKILVMVFALALATSAFAQKKVTADYNGIVDKYDAATKTLIIKRKDKQGEFVITDASEVLSNNAKADASAIAVGQKAEVEFWLDGAKKIVTKLKVSGAAKK
jgi:hypothetical protein